jgi:deazaflavin-dependent oxidoreductase (nitroreductase family)
VLDADVRRVLEAAAEVELGTTGARSGELSTVPIWGWVVADRYVITGTPGPRDWFANVLQNPRVSVAVAGRVLRGTAGVIDDPEFRERVFTAPETGWYLTQCSLEELVESAPMIEIEFD